MNPVKAHQVCAQCEQAIRHGSGHLSDVPGLLKRIINDRLWEERKVETGEIVHLNSLAELITKKPFEGWGESIDKVQALIQDDPEVLALWRDAITAKPHKHKADNDNVIITRQGNSKEYTVSRLAKNHPALFAKVKSGKLSANAAAIKAGFRKQKTPLEQLKAWWGKASNKEREAFDEWRATLPRIDNDDL